MTSWQALAVIGAAAGGMGALVHFAFAHGLWTEVAAAWVQAVGSVVAIVASAWIAGRQMKHASSLAKRELDEARRQAEVDRNEVRQAGVARQVVATRVIWEVSQHLVDFLEDIEQQRVRMQAFTNASTLIVGWAQELVKADKLSAVRSNLASISPAEMANAESAAALISIRQAAATAQSDLVHLTGYASNGISFEGGVEVVQMARMNLAAALEEATGSLRRFTEGT